MRSSKGKWFLLVLVAIMVASMGIFFAGCSGDDDKDDNGGPTGPGNGSKQCADITPCPNGAGMIGFCVVGNASSCYYTLNGRNYQCNSCSDLQGCAQAVVNACGR